MEIPLARCEDIFAMPANVTLPEEWLQDEPDPDLTHVSILERHSQKATDLPSVMLSAKSTTHHEPLIFVLLRHDNKPYLVLYNVNRQELMQAADDEILQLLQCDSTEQKAIVSPKVVEGKALEAVEAWCRENQLNPADCEHLCAIYLKPSSNQEQNLKDMLTSKTGG